MRRPLSSEQSAAIAAGRARKEADSLAAIERALAAHPLAYVAFSGGKDSTVLSHLARQVNPDVLHVYHDDELLFSEQASYIERSMEQMQLQVIQGFTVQRGWFRPWAGLPLCWRAPFPGMVDTGLRAGKASMQVCGWLGYEMQLVGLHSGESSGRDQHLREVGTEPYSVYVWQQGQSIYRVQPLADWSSEDIWDYIRRHGLDYCRAYDQLMQVESNPHAQRISNLALAPGKHIVACEGLDTLRRLERRYGKRWDDYGRLLSARTPGH